MLCHYKMSHLFQWGMPNRYSWNNNTADFSHTFFPFFFCQWFILNHQKIQQWVCSNENSTSCSTCALAQQLPLCSKIYYIIKLNFQTEVSTLQWNIYQRKPLNTLLIICHWFLTEILSGLHLVFVPMMTLRELYTCRRFGVSPLPPHIAVGW